MLTGGFLQADVLAYEAAFAIEHDELALWLSGLSVISAIGGAGAGWLADRVEPVRVFRIAIFISGAGCALFSWASSGGRVVAAIAAYCLAGLGMGAFIIGNLLVSSDGRGEENRSINSLHAFHGVARLAAIGVSILAIAVDWRYSYLFLGAVFLLLAAMPSGGASATRIAANGQGVPLPRFLPGVLVAFFAYMVAEMTAVTWIAAYCEEVRAWRPSEARFAYGVFLAGLIVGRGFVGKFWPAELPRGVIVRLALAHPVAIAAISLGGDGVALGGLFVAGLMEGPGWPSLYAWAIRRSSGCEGRVTSAIYVVVCAGIVAATGASGFLAEAGAWGGLFASVVLAHAVFSGVFAMVVGRE